MPTLNQHVGNEVVKLLLLADPGSGKTGSLASLANAGYRLVILDFDNGLEILSSFVRPEAMKNVYYITLVDEMQSIAGNIIPKGMPRAYQTAMAKLDNWTEPDGPTLGSIHSWGPETILVVDSLTMMGIAAMHYTQYMRKSLGKKRSFVDWGISMERQEAFCELLWGPTVKCNVIVTAHITYIDRTGRRAEEDDEEAGGKPVDKKNPLDAAVDDVPGIPMRAYPSALGNKLPPKIGRYFTSIFMLETMGSGLSVKRVIRTAPTHTIPLALRTTLPKELPAELDISDGLAKAFKILSDHAKKVRQQAQGGTIQVSVPVLSSSLSSLEKLK